MKIISFAWTTPAVRARRKTVTRREWDVAYARKFKQGEICQAYDKSPRIGGKPFGLIRLVKEPYLEGTDQIPNEDFESEGFAYLEEIGATLNGITPRELWNDWKLVPRLLWVVRFEIVKIQ